MFSTHKRSAQNTPCFFVVFFSVSQSNGRILKVKKDSWRFPQQFGKKRWRYWILQLRFKDFGTLFFVAYQIRDFWLSRLPWSIESSMLRLVIFAMKEDLFTPNKKSLANLPRIMERIPPWSTPWVHRCRLRQTCFVVCWSKETHRRITERNWHRNV